MFDHNFYFFLYPELKDICQNNSQLAYNHWINNGQKENRICEHPNKDRFDWVFYINSNNLKQENIFDERNAIIHWYTKGKEMNLSCNENNNFYDNIFNHEYDNNNKDSYNSQTIDIISNNEEKIRVLQQTSNIGEKNNNDKFNNNKLYEFEIDKLQKKIKKNKEIFDNLEKKNIKLTESHKILIEDDTKLTSNIEVNHKKNDDLQLNYNELCEEYNSREIIYKNRLLENNNLSEELEKINNKIIGLNKHEENLEIEKKNLKNLINSTIDEKENYIIRIGEEKLKILESESVLNSKKNEITIINNELDNLDKNLHISEETIRNIEKDLENLILKKDEKINDIQELKIKNKETLKTISVEKENLLSIEQKKLDETNDSINITNIVNEKFKRRIDETKVLIENGNSEKIRINKIYSDFQLEYSQLTESSESIAKKIENCEKEKTTIKDIVLRKRNENNKLNDIYNTLTFDIDKYNNELKGLEEGISNINSKLIQDGIILQELKKDILPVEETKKNLINKKVNLDDSIINIKEKTSEIIDENNKLQFKIQELDNDKKIRNRDLTKKQSEFETNKTIYDKYTEKLTELNKEISESGFNIQTIEEDIEKIKKEINEKEIKIIDLKENLYNYNNKINKYNKVNKNLKCKLDGNQFLSKFCENNINQIININNDISEEICNSESNIDELIIDKNEKSIILNGLNDDLKELTVKICSLNFEIENLNNENIEKVCNIDNSDKLISKLHEKIVIDKNSIKENDKNLLDKTNIKNELEINISGIQKENFNILNEIKIIDKTLTDSNDRFRNENSILDMNKESVRELNNKIENVQLEFENKKRDILEIKNNISKMETSLQINNDELSEYNDIIETLNKINDNMIDTNIDITEKMTVIKDELESKKKENREKFDEINLISESYSNLFENYNLLNDKLKEKDDYLLKCKEKYNQNNDLYNELLGQHDKTIEIIKEEMLNMSKQNTKLQIINNKNDKETNKLNKLLETKEELNNKLNGIQKKYQENLNQQNNIKSEILNMKKGAINNQETCVNNQETYINNDNTNKTSQYSSKQLISIDNKISNNYREYSLNESDEQLYGDISNIISNEILVLNNSDITKINNVNNNIKIKYKYDTNPLINILTRTSNRPNYFYENRYTILSQTYKNIRQIISVDNDLSYKYVKQCKVNDEDIVRLKSTSRVSHTHMPYNLYCNRLMEKVTEGWIMYLDDDDILYHENTINSILPLLNDTDNIIIWKCLRQNNIYPVNFRRCVKQYDIGSNSFMFHSKNIKYAQWDDKESSDFRCIDKLIKINGIKVKWFDNIISKINNCNIYGRGEKKDKPILNIINNFKYMVIFNQINSKEFPSKNIEYIEYENEKHTDIEEYFDKIYILNLERRQDRWNIMKNRLNDKNITSCIRYIGIDGNLHYYKCQYDKYSKLPFNKYDHLYKRKAIPSSGSWAILLSMHSLLKDAVKNNYKKILVLQDDIIFHNDFNNLFKKKINKISENWKLLYLGASQKKWEKIIINNETDYYNSYNTDGAFAVGIDCSVFDTLLKEIEKIQAPFDSGALQFIQKKYKDECFVFFPNIIIADVRDSDCRESRNIKQYSEVFKWNIGDFDLSKNNKIENCETYNKKLCKETILNKDSCNNDNENKIKYVKGLVSIIVTTYNSSKYIYYCIESLVRQTYKNIEIIIVDDDSEDNTMEELQKIIKIDKRIKVIRNDKNYGTYISKNIGIKYSLGEYIAFNDSDDYSMSNRIETQLNFLKNNLEFQGCNCGFISRSTKKLSIAEITLFMRRTLIDNIGFFDSVRVAADTEYRRRAGASGFKIKYINQYLYTCMDRFMEGNSKGKKTSLTLSKEVGINSNTRNIYRRQFEQYHNLIETKNKTPYIDFPQYNRHFTLDKNNQFHDLMIPKLSEKMIKHLSNL